MKLSELHASEYNLVVYSRGGGWKLRWLAIKRGTITLPTLSWRQMAIMVHAETVPTLDLTTLHDDPLSKPEEENHLTPKLIKAVLALMDSPSAEVNITDHDYFDDAFVFYFVSKKRQYKAVIRNL